MDATGRFFLCAGCRAQVVICSPCDRGQRYCAGGCGQAAREHSVREAGRRYQYSRRGRFNHAARNRRYRARQRNVTHQGSPAPAADDLLPVTSTTRDRHAATTVLDLVPTALVPDGARLYPVGRLDQDSEGMLLLTNDGAWAERVLHPRHGVEREYALGLDAPLDADQVEGLRGGIPLDEGLATLGHLREMTPVEVDRLRGLLDPPPAELVWYRATLMQGWKRQLRRMFGAVGAPVQRLVRVRIGPVRIDGLRSGRTRPLKAPEVRGLGSGGGRSRR